jgi:prepilin-type N-terminal cleavage/methylation domain-containing protein
MKARGFTLVELAASMAISAVVLMAVIGLIRISQGGAQMSSAMTSSWGDIRRSSGTIADDLSQCSATHMTLLTASGEQQLTVQRPLGTTAGVTDWGVCDPSQSLANRMRLGWFVRYKVVTTGGERHLVRQLLDSALVLQSEQVMVRRLRAGSANPPGFKVAANGAMWTVTLSVTGSGGAAETLSFDVTLRNT